MDNLKTNLILYTAILALCFLFVGALLARSVARPLDKLARQALGMAESLQRRIGNDLHDDLAQKIVGISFLAKAYGSESRQKKSDGAEHFDRLATLADGAVQTARDLARGLSPVSLLRHGLGDALVALAAETEERSSGVLVKPQISSDIPLLEEEYSLHLYRIAQEAISNAVKHGAPSEIIVSLSFENGSILLSVANNGRSFATNDGENGMGLAIMAMRSRSIGASFSVTTRPDDWTEVRCDFRTGGRGR